MPLDEYGNKWACPPCVRGHRAMKCFHWDRFMVQVRKPGRPLTDCPHPKQKNCGCSSKNDRPEYPVEKIMIAKDQPCLCRVIYPSSSHEGPRLDANHPPPFHTSHGPFPTPYPISYQQPMETNFPTTSAPNNLAQSPFDQGLLEQPVYHQQTQRIVGFPSHHQGSADIFASQNVIAGITAPNNGEALLAYSGEPRSSCCSSQNISQEKNGFQDAGHSGTVDMLRGCPQTDLYRIPAGFATYENPMKPEQQAELAQSDPDFMQTIPAYADDGIMGTAALPAETNDHAHSTMATMHSCSCGTGCQCLACPVHPGNATTQGIVQDLSQILDGDLELYSSAEDGLAWPNPPGNNESPMGTMNEDFSVFRINPEDSRLGQPSDPLLPSMNQSPSSVSNGHYLVPTSTPGQVPYPSNQPPEGRENGHEGGYRHAMLSHNYLHFQFPVHHNPGTQE